MKIFSAAQVKKWDEFTIAQESVTYFELMECAATACCTWLLKQGFENRHFSIFCGKGNNGGDGLALARLLLQNNCKTTVYILEFGKPGTAGFQQNLERLHPLTTEIHFLQDETFYPQIHKSDIVIDALFGTGLNKPLQGIGASLVNHINRLECTVISIDMPSGLFADKSSMGNTVIRATYTLSFQAYKLAFLMPENSNNCGIVDLLDIGLSKAFERTENAAWETLEYSRIKTIYKPRNLFSHKGTFGHAALLCGSRGMMGAAVLSAQACLRSGAGKLTVYIPECGYTILQVAVPEAMCHISGDDFLHDATGLENFNAIGMGPGMGRYASHKKLLARVFETVQFPVVLDADALNILAKDKTLMALLPRHSIITPHPKEFEQLFGKTATDFDRMKLARDLAVKLNIYIVLKGHYSIICCPQQDAWPVFFNSTGNPGMATAGSGDVLTGILTGLLAQGYSPGEACMLGVYLHGLAGDLAAADLSQEALIAGDIINYLGKGFTAIQKKNPRISDSSGDL